MPRTSKLTISGPIADLTPHKRAQLDDLENQSLDELYIYNTDLEEIPDLPSSLEMFYCEDNRNMLVLPYMGGTDIHTLVCNNNRSLTSLGLLEYTSIRSLKCNHNRNLQIDNLPNLVELYCSFNRNLSELPDMQQSDMHTLVATNNNLTHFPNVPDGLKELRLKGNPLMRDDVEKSLFRDYIIENYPNCVNDLIALAGKKRKGKSQKTKTRKKYKS